MWRPGGPGQAGTVWQGPSASDFPAEEKPFGVLSSSKVGDSRRSMQALRRSIWQLSNQQLRHLTTSPPLQRAAVHKSRKHRQNNNMSSEMTTLKGTPLERGVVESHLQRCLFYTPSNEIYGGVKGLYDYGPPGCSLQRKIMQVWHNHFVEEEHMLEVECPALTPEKVFEVSGHVARFKDWMCTDPKTGNIFRADHFVQDVLEARLKADKQARGQSTSVEKAVDAKRAKKAAALQQQAAKLDDAVVNEYEEVLAKIDNYDDVGLRELIDKYDLRCPSGEKPTPPTAFNLMFETSIGPNSSMRGYLRPETAQGQFTNFAKLYQYNRGIMPFASASVGKSYRNEIAPRNGPLRVREFLMAEIEHYVDPETNKKHERFHEVEDVELDLLPRDVQLAGKSTTIRKTVREAVKERIIDNETLGYFLARIYLFLVKIGVDPTKLRFRQHMENEMAHYASDCYDAELLTSYGWVECVGCADRSAYDLSVHTKASGTSLTARQQFSEPRTVNTWEVNPNQKLFGPKFKKDGAAVKAALSATSQEQREAFAKELETAGKIPLDVPGLGSVEVGKELLTIELKEITSHHREYIPNVIEPSFGIGRIQFALCEHNYWTREGDEARAVLSFPPIVAPHQAIVLPLSNHADFTPIVKRVQARLKKAGVSTQRPDETSATIGKRYARTDELGTALAITVDFQTIADGTITLRDRDTTRQVRAEEDKILAAVSDIVRGSKKWEDVEKELPVFTTQGE